MSSDRDKTGFTLIEMLIAMAMIVTIVSMVYGSYAATSRSVERYDRQLKCAGRANLVLRLMARQIRGAYAPPEDANTPAGNRLGTGQLDKIQIEPPAHIFQGDAQDPRGRFLSFVTTAALGTGPNAPRGLGQISYQFDSTTGTLAISSQPFRDHLTEPESTAQWRPLLKNVETLHIEFHDGREWRQKWSAQRNGLPRAVRFQLTVLDEKDRPCHVGTTVSPVSRTTAVRNTSQPGTGARKP